MQYQIHIYIYIYAYNIGKLKKHKTSNLINPNI